jgi:signal transduction histidine kinase
VGQRVLAPKARTRGRPSERLFRSCSSTSEEEAPRGRAWYFRTWSPQDERRRLAQDPHDDPMQTLTYPVRMLEHLSDNEVANRSGSAGASRAELAAGWSIFCAR